MTSTSALRFAIPAMLALACPLQAFAFDAPCGVEPNGMPTPCPNISVMRSMKGSEFCEKGIRAHMYHYVRGRCVPNHRMTVTCCKKR